MKLYKKTTGNITWYEDDLGRKQGECIERWPGKDAVCIRKLYVNGIANGEFQWFYMNRKRKPHYFGVWMNFAYESKITH